MRFFVFFPHPETGEYLFIRGCHANSPIEAIQRVMGKHADPNKYVALDGSKPELMEKVKNAADLVKIA